MTKRKLGVLFIWLALASFFGGMKELRPYQGDSRSTRPPTARPYQYDNIVRIASDLTNRSECSFPQSSISSPGLCNTSSGSLDEGAFRSLRDRLGAGVNGTDALCEIDAALVQAQKDCSSTQHLGDIQLIAGLMRLLAASWKRQGDLNRADQLYQAAYRLEEKTPDQLELGKIAVLRDWANLKVQLGELQRARELAALQTELARRDQQAGRASSSLLISSLKFQATIFERVGSVDEASAARQEAARLSAHPDTCEGACLPSQPKRPP
jgi:hypothetical protein